MQEPRKKVTDIHKCNFFYATSGPGHGLYELGFNGHAGSMSRPVGPLVTPYE